MIRQFFTKAQSLTLRLSSTDHWSTAVCNLVLRHIFPAPSWDLSSQVSFEDLPKTLGLVYLSLSGHLVP